jgi:hypothetical protein
MKLPSVQKAIIGEYEFDLGKGVDQRSVLSPFLFIFLFHEALSSSPLLSQMIRRGDLMAYADDVLIQSSSMEELRQALKEFDKLVEHWGLSLNRKKCDLMPHSDFSA